MGFKSSEDVVYIKGREVDSLVVLPYNSKGSGWGVGIGSRTMFMSSLKVKDDVLAPYGIRVGCTCPIPGT